MTPEQEKKNRDDIVDQLKAAGLPVFESIEDLAQMILSRRSKQEIAIDKAYWTGVQRSATIFLTDPTRAGQMLEEAGRTLARLQREINGEVIEPTYRSSEAEPEGPKAPGSGPRGSA